MDELASGASSNISHVLRAAVMRLDMDYAKTALLQTSEDVDKLSGMQDYCMSMMVAR